MSSVDDPVQRVLEKLEGVKKNAKGWTAFCPAHDDRRDRSLSVSRGDDGRALVHCFAGCQRSRSSAALGFTMADLFPPRPKRAPPQRSRPAQEGRGRCHPPEAPLQQCNTPA